MKRLWSHLSKQRKKQFYLLFLLMIVASVAEVVSIGAILPFLGILVSPESVFNHDFVKPINQVFHISSPDEMLLPLTFFFIATVCIAAVIRLLLLYTLTRTSFGAGADLSVDIYRRTLYQRYEVHITRNSSEVINNIITKTNVVINGVLNPMLVFINSVILVVAIIITLLLINKVITLSALFGFGLIYLVVVLFFRKKLKSNSLCIADKSTQMVKSLQEGLGGIRDVLISGAQEFYCQLYRDADRPMRRAAGNNIFIGQGPRYIIEAIGMVLIIGLAYLMSINAESAGAVLPVLGVFALGAQRLLPALQQAYGAYSNIKGSQSSLLDVLHMLDQKVPDFNNLSNTPLPFKHSIRLNNISFRYSDNSPWVLKNINLTFQQGVCVGFKGITGSGKSTLLDMIMGLLTPTQGEIFIDNKKLSHENMNSWRVNIAHVPQDIYLSDSTIEENIAFGVPKDQINHKQVIIAAKKAQIYDLIEKWPDKYQTFVGERGVRLSGGQLQRIGIARALYSKAKLIIFDEATSALDVETESAVMNSIRNLDDDITIFIIAHRLTTLKGCSQIVELEKIV